MGRATGGGEGDRSGLRIGGRGRAGRLKDVASEGLSVGIRTGSTEGAASEIGAMRAERPAGGRGEGAGGELGVARELDIGRAGSPAGEDGGRCCEVEVEEIVGATGLGDFGGAREGAVLVDCIGRGVAGAVRVVVALEDRDMDTGGAARLTGD